MDSLSFLLPKTFAPFLSLPHSHTHKHTLTTYGKRMIATRNAQYTSFIRSKSLCHCHLFGFLSPHKLNVNVVNGYPKTYHELFTHFHIEHWALSADFHFLFRTKMIRDLVRCNKVWNWNGNNETINTISWSIKYNKYFIVDRHCTNTSPPTHTHRYTPPSTVYYYYFL